MWSSLIMPIRQKQMVLYSTVNHSTFMEENPGRFILNMKVSVQRKKIKTILEGERGSRRRLSALYQMSWDMYIIMAKCLDPRRIHINRGSN